MEKYIICPPYIMIDQIIEKYQVMYVVSYEIWLFNGSSKSYLNGFLSHRGYP